MSKSVMSDGYLSGSARWLGASVWVGDRLATSFEINSGSGTDYRPAAGTNNAPEPATAALLLLALGLMRVRLRHQPR